MPAWGPPTSEQVVAVVRKTVLTPGIHISPGGRVEVTPRRVQHWVDTFQALKAEGVEFPVPFGHALAARPGETEFLNSRYNAGYIQSLETGPRGELVAVIDAPAMQSDGRGNLIDPKEGTALREVSAGIGNWTDGKGRTHTDIINHIALTPLPVWAGQDGFAPLSTQRHPLTCLSTLTLSGVTRMATDKDKKPDIVAEAGDDVTVVADKSDMPDEDFDEVAEELGQPGEDSPVEAPPEAPAVNPVAELIANAKAELGKAGLNLPDLGGEPDLQQFVEHLVVAVAALNSQAAKPQPGDEADLPKPVAEEGTPVMMSTLTTRERALADQLHATDQERRSNRIEALIGRGLKPTVANKLRAEAGQTKLSLSAANRPLPAAVDAKLDLLDEQLPAKAPLLTKLASAAVEQQNPLVTNGETVVRNGIPMTAAAAKEADLMLELSTGRKKKS